MLKWCVSYTREGNGQVYMEHVLGLKLCEQASQRHGMCCHDLEVMNSNPGRVELGVHSPSVLSCT